MWEKKYWRAEQDTDDNVAHAQCMLDKVTHKHTHTEYVILIAFTPQQWLPESASMLRYTYIACLVIVRRKMLNWYLQVFVIWIPCIRHLGTEKCRNFTSMILVILRSFVCYCVHWSPSQEIRRILWNQNTH